MRRFPSLTRRAFTAGCIAGVPTLLISQRSSSQTAVAPLIAVTPYELRDTLATTPIDTRYKGNDFGPVRWVGTSASPYVSSVGGAHVVINDNLNAIFGDYIVYHDERGAESGAFLGKQALRNLTTDTFPKTIEGYGGEVIVYEQRETYSLTLVPIRNVLVIGYDTDAQKHDGHVREHHHEDGHSSISHAAILIKHLLPLLNRQT